MGKTILIMHWLLRITTIQHWAILIIRFLQLAVFPQTTTKSKYLTSAPILGQPSRHLHFVLLRKFDYNLITNSYPHFSINRYGVVSRKGSVMIIGGFCDGLWSSRIFEYTFDDWKSAGNLQGVRGYHRAIFNGDRIYVVGGYDTQ